MLPLHLPPTYGRSERSPEILGEGSAGFQILSKCHNYKRNLKGMKEFPSPSPSIQVAFDICQVHKPPWEQILSRQMCKKKKKSIFQSDS